MVSSKNITEIDDKTIGHIRVLYDNGCFDTLKEGSIGISYSLKKILITADTLYRLTVKGYELLDLLRNDNVFNKIKDFSISTALEVGKSVLINAMTMGL